MASVILNLQSPQFNGNLVEIRHVLERATARITLWGVRVVEVKDGSHTICLRIDQLRDRILMAGRARSRADDLTPEERIAGIEILTKIQTLHANTETELRHKNFFTKILVWLREFRFPRFTCCGGYDWTDEREDFLSFNIKEFCSVFKIEEKKLHDRHYPSSMTNFSFNGSRIIASEEAIRNLIARP
jgi:hypothetical protein